jgi:MFS family permease
MTFDELKKTWQTHQSGFTLTIDSNLLLKEIQRNKEYFRWTVFLRDMCYIGFAFAGFLFFGYVGLEENFWPLLLLALLILSVGVFLVANRIVRKRKRPKTFQSLSSYVEDSLEEVKHQIWLMNNVFWWFFLPISTGIAVFVGYSAWDARDHRFWFMFDIVFFAVFIFYAYLVYRGIQKDVNKELIPRKQELEQLRDSLRYSDE